MVWKEKFVRTAAYGNHWVNLLEILLTVHLKAAGIVAAKSARTGWIEDRLIGYQQLIQTDSSHELHPQNDYTTVFLGGIIKW